MIYEPAEDSDLLEKYVRIYAKGKVLDMGCGSGIQSFTALTKTKDVIAADINKEAVDYCKKQGLNAIVSDLFSNINGKFDLIIFNPPYLPKNEDEDDESALITTGGNTGIELITRFLRDAKDYLKDDGKILIVFSTLTGDVNSVISKYSYKFKQLDSKKVFFEELKVYLIYW